MDSVNKTYRLYLFLLFLNMLYSYFIEYNYLQLVLNLPLIPVNLICKPDCLLAQSY